MGKGKDKKEKKDKKTKNNRKNKSKNDLDETGFDDIPLGNRKLNTESLDTGIYLEDGSSASRVTGATSDYSLASRDKSQSSHNGNSVHDANSRTQIFGEDENEERGNWTGRFDFILSMLGYAVGLGNVWRFPYLCYRNGGGAFLLPFLLMMAIVGVPLFFLEASLGQFCSSGPMTCWKFAPLFKGVGIAMVVVSALTSIYYNMILAWSQFYLFASFTSELPWKTCDNTWNTRDCSLKLPKVTCADGDVYNNGTCYEKGEFVGLWNVTLFQDSTGRKRALPSEEYWTNHALKMSDSIDDFGLPDWRLVLNLMLAWVICFFCLIKGIKTTGKVVYFTAIFPYVVLLILFFRGVTLPNASEGIYYFIVPDFARLGDARVWKDAANQIFFSMSIAGGGLVTLSSYNRFHNNIIRDSFIVSLGDSITCVFAGFVIFSYLGYMAGKLGVDIKDVATDGAGLAFTVYPEAVSSLPPSTLWSILFFFMLITLGLDSQFAMLETVLTGCLDQFPALRPKKTWVILGICVLFFILGLPLTTPGGMYLLQLMDNFVGGWTLIIIGFFELVAVIFVYGANRFCNDIRIMTGYNWFLWWKICWYGLSPVTIGFIFIFTWVDYSRLTYGDYTYPIWAEVLGWLLAFTSIAAIPAVMLYRINKEDEGDNACQKVQLLTIPTEEWGPALVKHRKLVHYVTDFVVDPWEAKRANTFVNYAFKSQSRDTLDTGSYLSEVTTESRFTRGSRTTGHSVHTVSSFESTV
ncbi:sodium- and chloride-dependent glycine transporter 1-like [Haliotis cracherodii]|uniref:sodium- and chloride-dependent glycine transporter 1-like n=1 Tax=Haliotis cracherodii TaxID=6455 RepID=UPI0039E96FFF